ncbi:cell wall metabolism sensor histidine kinase WalK [bacterium]|nr:cell wall metabolism sensor histidine kinase WalK [bacterium]
MNKKNNYSKTLRIGYRIKLLGAISLVSALVFGVLTLNRIILLKRLLEERVITRINTIGNILSEEIKDNLLENNTENLYELISIAEKQKRITFVLIANNENIVLVSSGKKRENKLNTYTDSKKFEYEKQVYIQSFPIKHKQENIAFVQIGFSLKELSAGLTTALNWSIGIGTTGLLIILTISWYLTKKLLAPLEQMRKVSQQFAEGNFSTRLPGISNDIIGKLEISLNSMAQQLDDTNRNLVTRIKEAVSKYEASNRALQEKTGKLADMNKRLIEMDKLKSEFVSVVSHELRTPLTSIIGYAKILTTLKLSDEQKGKYLHVIENEGKRLAKLVSDFLDITKIESGTMTFQPVEFDVRDLIKEVAENFNVSHEIGIDTNVPSIPTITLADRDKIKQVFLNLLANASRYTPAGKNISITVEKENDKIKISVRDEGPGMNKEVLEKIFDKFYRCNDDISKKSRGSGLGLAITRGILSQHKGEIWAESEPGKGSTFIFTLPEGN